MVEQSGESGEQATSATQGNRLGGLHVTIENKHLLPGIFHDFVAEILD